MHVLIAALYSQMNVCFLLMILASQRFTYDYDDDDV
jgi:hypothetical protein